MNKLTPQNVKQEHLVQILLAKMQGIEVEFYSSLNKEWVTSGTRNVYVNTNYRIKTHELPITKEMWAMIDKEWKWAAKDVDGIIYFYTNEPLFCKDRLICDGGSYTKSIFALDTDDIDWRQSLTKRPEWV
ncbi:hypothetical protein [uncultured Gilliamella sp.]|uniref:hypothetical protein n=1 Tax=uncultured Gilliamella sp. TaxID=1193505 RepID=UPI0025F376FD|nr:hypothetical protein [uncultured Gilliamella sp.]